MAVLMLGFSREYNQVPKLFFPKIVRTGRLVDVVVVDLALNKRSLLVSTERSTVE